MLDRCTRNVGDNGMNMKLKGNNATKKQKKVSR